MTAAKNELCQAVSGFTTQLRNSSQSSFNQMWQPEASHLTACAYHIRSQCDHTVRALLNSRTQDPAKPARVFLQGFFFFLLFFPSTTLLLLIACLCPNTLCIFLRWYTTFPWVLGSHCKQFYCLPSHLWMWKWVKKAFKFKLKLACPDISKFKSFF